MNIRKVGNEVSARSEAEVNASGELKSLLLESIPQMGPKWDIHLPAFLTAPSLARMLWLDTVYRKAMEVPGCLVEFGSQWGASLNTFLLLKQIHEPWNAGRKILSFSTFGDGFKSADKQDGANVKLGDYSVADEWEVNLRHLLKSHAARSPIGAEANFEVIPGDARETFRAYLEAHPELILSHVHFDMDVYAPTKDLITVCVARMPRGAILIFDELNCPPFPGETVALQETLGLANLALRKSPFQPYSAYAIVG
ncbi:MAG: crotonobetainyl-CoA--carnitine CoA-transferase, partial [Akkermansiaceae bacterium]|nr:crotonobetainyl-CoA--carnitine CoA-transferase [Verrucomicrobiales bacterium]